MKRVIVFIDGLNVRFRLRECGWSEYYDVGRVATELAGPRELVHAAFYHPTPNVEHLGEAQYAIERAYLESVRRDKNVVVPAGAYMAKRDAWVGGKKVGHVWEEKQTDVLLASDLVFMAATNQIDAAVVASADADIVPAIRRCTELGVPVELLRFRGRNHPRLYSLEEVSTSFRRARPSYFRPYATA
jgi:uncharacterized LabA/DUF88 family protein